MYNSLLIHLSCITFALTFQWGMLSNNHYWGYYPGILSCSQVSTTYLKIRVPNLQISCSDLTSRLSARVVAPMLATRTTCPTSYICLVAKFFIVCAWFRSYHHLWLTLTKNILLDLNQYDQPCWMWDMKDVDSDSVPKPIASDYVHGLVQDCWICYVSAVEIPQICLKPHMWVYHLRLTLWIMHLLHEKLCSFFIV